MGQVIGKKNKQKPLKLLIFGLEGSGKTTICNYLNEIPNLFPIPTLGIIIYEINYNIPICLYEVGGNQNIIKFCDYYINNVDGYILVIDISKKIEEHQFEWFYQILNKINSQSMIILANKQDQKIITKEQLYEKFKNIKTQNELYIFETSGKYQTGIKEALNYLINNII